MSNTTKATIQQVAVLLCCYAFLILCNGYLFGYGDQVEVLPLVYQYFNPTLYAKDFFVQQYLVSGSWIRDGLVWFSLPGNFIGMENWYLLLHFSFSMLLITGVFKVLQTLTADVVQISVAICTILGLTFGYIPGDNEIWYPQVIPSLISEALLIWAFYFYTRKIPLFWILIIVAAACFQPLSALQVLVIFVVAEVFEAIKGNWQRISGQKIILIVLILIASCGGLLYMYLRLTHSMADMIPYLMWRLPHHFDPIQFSVKSWLVFGVLVIPGLIYLYTLRSRLFVPLVIALLGALLYALFYQIVPEIILTQWYKSMLWVKTIAGGATLIYLMKQLQQSRVTKRKSYLFIVLIVLVLGVWKGPLTWVEYDLPLVHQEMNDEVKIAKSASRLLPLDAVVAIPVANSTFKIFAKRSCYVDYKSTVFSAGVFNEWMTRLGQLYGASLLSRQGRADLGAMDRYYNNIIRDRDFLTTLGITHVLTIQEIKDGSLILQQGRWKIYSLRGSSGRDSRE